MSLPQRVEFLADGVRLVGHLHAPVAADRPAAGIVIAIPGPSVKEQVGDRYGRLLSERDFACLAFDPRNYGESDGEPRQREDPFGKLLDLQGAVTFLRHHDGVDPERIAVLGISIGGGYALKAAAFDPRIKAFVGVAGSYPSPYLTRDAMGATAFRTALLDAVEALELRDTAQELPTIPVVDPEGDASVLPPGPLAEEFAQFYLTSRGGHARFRNRLTRDSAYLGLISDTAMAADFLSPTPALIVHGKGDLPPADADAARAIFARLGEPKRLLMLDTRGHIDLYDVEEFIGAAMSATAEFLDEHLRHAGPCS
jgi:uncharacterized protein